MHFKVDLGHERNCPPQSLPLGRLRRRMGFRGPLPNPDDRRRTAASALPARGLQRLALDGAFRLPVAHDPKRFASLAHHLPAEPPLDRGRMFHRPRP